MKREFDNRDAFVKWISRCRGVPKECFAIVHKGQEILSLSSDDEVPGMPTARRFVRVPLPSAQEAAKWWDEVFYNTTLDVWFHANESVGVIVLASPAIWRPTTTLYAMYGESDFQRIDVKKLKRLIDNKEIQRMFGECGFAGVSVRFLNSLAMRKLYRSGEIGH